MIARLVLLTAVAAALAACGPMRPSPPTVGIKSAGCDTSTPGARCSVGIRPGSTYACGEARFTIDPEVLELRGNRPVNIVWTVDAPFAFCGTNSVYLKPGFLQDYQEVYESFSAETDDGVRGPNMTVQGKCKQRWHWNWRNNGNAYYQYNIELTDTRTGRSCTIDPYIKNG